MQSWIPFIPESASTMSWKVDAIYFYLSGVTLFFASHLLIFWALGSAGVHIGVAFYIWIGVFNMVAVAHYGFSPADVTAELERREGTSGIEEKALRKAQDREASND